MTDDYNRELNAHEEKKDYFYLRTYVGEKLKENYIPFRALENVRKEIEKREAIDREISKLKKTEKESPVFLTEVVTEEILETLVLPVAGFRKREIYKNLRNTSTGMSVTGFSYFTGSGDLLCAVKRYVKRLHSIL